MFNICCSRLRGEVVLCVFLRSDTFAFCLLCAIICAIVHFVTIASNFDLFFEACVSAVTSKRTGRDQVPFTHASLHQFLFVRKVVPVRPSAFVPQSPPLIL